MSINRSSNKSMNTVGVCKDNECDKIRVITVMDESGSFRTYELLTAV